MIVLPDVSKKGWQDRIVRDAMFGGGGADGVHLFKSDLTLDADTTLADLQDEEADFPGYAAQNLIAPSYSVIVGAVARMTFASVTFTMDDDSPANTIYGYWVRRDYFGVFLCWCEKFDTPVEMDANGAELIFIPRLDWGQLS